MTGIPHHVEPDQLVRVKATGELGTVYRIIFGGRVAIFLPSRGNDDVFLFEQGDLEPVEVPEFVPDYATPRAFADFAGEFHRARTLFPPMHSAHEGLAVLWEEFEELKTEVFASPRNRNYPAMRAEAIQVAARALRMVVDVIDPAIAALEEGTDVRPR